MSLALAELRQIAKRNDEHAHILVWAQALGILAWDVGGSALLLLAHGDTRAVAILNRCLFEYHVRLRYYHLEPGKAREAVQQLGERFKRIYRADETLRERPDLTDEERRDFEGWLAERQKIEGENFKTQVLKRVEPERYEQYYNGYYGKASAYVHGYETILRDVFRDWYVESKPEPNFHSVVLKANDTAGVCIHQLLFMLAALESVGELPKRSMPLDRRWISIQREVGIL